VSLVTSHLRSEASAGRPAAPAAIASATGATPTSQEVTLFMEREPKLFWRPCISRFDLFSFGVKPSRILVAGLFHSKTIRLLFALLTLRAWAEGPLSPRDELKTFHLADQNLQIELVMAEPRIVSPVAVSWDAEGRMFVAEMLDYPTENTGGQIKLIEDRDGDGRYEHAIIFADKLPFPTSVLPWKDGVLVTAAPNIWFLQDTNRDGRADIRQILFTGFGEGNQQLRVNGLVWGLDNWVYGANGRNDGNISRPGDPAAQSIRRRDFRFRPGTLAFEAIGGQSQFGLGRDDWGNRFLSWNEIPLRHEVLPERYLRRNPHLALTETINDILPANDSRQVFQRSGLTTVFNREPPGFFNALAGLTIYRGQGLGEKYYGNAFVGETLRNLVHRRILAPQGVSFVAPRGERNREFLASTDPWFHPVNFATGPDDALYVVDFYRKFVEHPGYAPEKVRGQVAWRTGAEHGRIWRIKTKKYKGADRPIRPGGAKASQLIRHFESGNGWWRDTAQRLLVERQDALAIPLLRKAATKRSPNPFIRLHALYALDGLGGLTTELLDQTLRDPNPGLREHALRLSEPFLLEETTNSIHARKLFEHRSSTSIALAPSRRQDQEIHKRQLLEAAVVKLVEDPDLRVQFQLALTLGGVSEDEKIPRLIRLAERNPGDRWCLQAILSSIGERVWPFLQKFLQQNSAWMVSPSPPQGMFLKESGKLIGASSENADALGFDRYWQEVSRPRPGHLFLLAGFFQGLPPAKQAWAGPNSNTAMVKFTRFGAEVAASPGHPVHTRLAAIQVLAHNQPQALLDLLEGEHSAEIELAAAQALVGSSQKMIFNQIFLSWPQYRATTRRGIIAGLAQSEIGAQSLMDALEQGQILPVELDASVRQALRTTKNPALRKRWENRGENQASPGPSRAEVIQSFKEALDLKGDPERGGPIFSRLCLACHQWPNGPNRGALVGPNLSAASSRSKETLLHDILDPSREISPDFIVYRVEKKSGDFLEGLIASETGQSLTLRRNGQPDATLLRAEIEGIRAEEKSLMPEGLESGLSVQDFADLLAFLAHPEARL